MPTPIDDYLAALDEPARSTLTKLATLIRANVPAGTTEILAYNIPVFHSHSHIIGFAAFKNHCTLFPMDGSTVEKFKDEITPWKTSKGAIQFPTGKPLPATLVKKILKHRLAAASSGRTKKPG